MSQMAFSSVAFVIWLSRTWRKMRGHSPPCSGLSAASIGPSSWVISFQALSVHSPEKCGRSPTVHSPQPIRPSEWISASSTRRSRVTPKLVSNGRTSGMCSSRRIIASILIKFFAFLKFEDLLRLAEGCQLEDSISFRIQREANYRQPSGKCLLKLLAVLQLNGESAAPAGAAGLPLVDGGRNQNPLLGNVCRCRVPVKNGLNPGRSELPLSHEAIRG